MVNKGKEGAPWGGWCKFCIGKQGLVWKDLVCHVIAFLLYSKGLQRKN
jgi:hypothetical protein